MTYDLLYSGFDTLYVAFQGALPEKARRLLRKAKARAADEGQAALIAIGPGKVDIIYDKRRDSLDKRKLFWFKQWDIDPKDRSKAVWRVELRAGKQELKGRFRIATFDDLEAAIGDVYKIMAEQIRYVAEDQTDTNVTRQELHPLWRKVCEHVQFAMADKQSGLTRDQIKEIERDEAIDNATTMITAYAINMGIATGLSDEKIDEDLQKLVTAALSAQRDLNKGKFNKRVRRARERMHFIRR